MLGDKGLSMPEWEVQLSQEGFCYFCFQIGQLMLLWGSAGVDVIL